MGLLRKHITRSTDEELMVQVMDHQSSVAITELHRRYSKKLLGFFIRMLQQDEQLAQDHVQELFLRILEKNHLFNPEKKFSTWVFTIAANMCKNSYRRAPMASIDRIGSEQLHPVAYGENLAEKAHFHALLRASLDQLEEVHKTTFVLRYMEQFSLNEIADITGVSLGTVKSRLFYATRKMTEQLKAYDPHNETTLFKLM